MIRDFVPVARAIIGVKNLKIITFGPRPQDFFACNAPIKGLYELGVEVEENSELDLLVSYKAHAGDARIPGVIADMKAEMGEKTSYPDLLERMAQTMYLDEKIRDTVQCCEVTELILLISQVVTRRHNAPPPSATSLLVAKAVAYLQANYTDPHLTVAQLAKDTYTSREHLSRVFKEYTLESIHGYLTNLRMQHCRNELADGTGVLDACTASGFANYSSFLKSFRALYGIPPAEYRAQLRQSRRTP